MTPFFFECKSVMHITVAEPVEGLALSLVHVLEQFLALEKIVLESYSVLNQLQPNGGEMNKSQSY